MRLTLSSGEARRDMGLWGTSKEDGHELHLEEISFVGQGHPIKIDQTKTWRWMHSAADTDPFLAGPVSIALIVYFGNYHSLSPHCEFGTTHQI